MDFKNNNLFVGLIIIIVGLVLLAEQMNFLDEYLSLGKIWPVFVILAGIFYILPHLNKGGKNE